MYVSMLQQEYSWFGVSGLPRWRVVLVGPLCLPLSSAYQGEGDISLCGVVLDGHVPHRHCTATTMQLLVHQHACTGKTLHRPLAWHANWGGFP